MVLAATMIGQVLFAWNMPGRFERSLGYAFWTGAGGPILGVGLNCFELVGSAWLAMWLALKLKTPRAAAFLAFLTMNVGSYVIGMLAGFSPLFIDFDRMAGPGKWAVVQAMLIVPGALFTAAVFFYARRRVHRFFGVANDGHPAADPSHL